MRKLLASVLASRIGEVLTPELAIDIARTIGQSLKIELKCENFAPSDYGDFVFSHEKMRDILPELHVLHEAHYRETEVHRAGIALNPNYDDFVEIEERGGLLQFTARKKASGELVGNMRVYLHESMHTKTLVCTEDTFFVLPDYRGGFMAVRLWQYVERCCIEAGAREIYFDSKTINRADAMARYLNYKPVATKFVKVIDHV